MYIVHILYIYMTYIYVTVRLSPKENRERGLRSPFRPMYSVLCALFPLQSATNCLRYARISATRDLTLAFSDRGAWGSEGRIREK